MNIGKPVRVYEVTPEVIPAEETPVPEQVPEGVPAGVDS